MSYKLSGWPLLWQAYKGDRHIHHLADHAKFGSIVRISPNTLSFNTASALHTIYSARNANVKKAEWYKTFDIAAGAYSSFTETDREVHAVKRRWVAPTLLGESIKVNESRILSIIERFCDTLGSNAEAGWGKRWDASEMSTYLGFDIMGAVIFGTEFRSVQEEENRRLADSVLSASMFLYWVRLRVLCYCVTGEYLNTNINRRFRTCLLHLLFAHCYGPGCSSCWAASRSPIIIV